MKKVDYNGALKQKMRDRVAVPGRVAESLVDLPAAGCRSVIDYYRKGIITLDTPIYAIEFHKPTAETIKRKLRKLGFKNATVFNGRVEDCPYKGPFDIVNLDTESTMSRQLLDWVGQIDFIPGGELNLWVCANRSVGRWCEQLHQTFFETAAGRKIYHEVCRHTGVFKPQDVVAMSAVFAALNRYDFNIEKPFHYTQHVMPMFVYRFMGMQQSSTRQSLADILVGDVQYETVGGREKGEAIDGNIPQMCLKCLESPGKRAYVTRLLRQMLVRRKLENKDPFWVKAGWKSAISRICKDEAIAYSAHQLVDAA